MDNLDTSAFEELLTAVGEHLEAAGESAAIVVVGGSALAMRGWVDRTTEDVDVIARAVPGSPGRTLVHPDPLPAQLAGAIARVARDYGLRHDWVNTEVAMQWRTGLPDRLLDELEWRRFGTLDVGFAGRGALIALKLYAAVDHGSESVHFQDLVGLEPTDGELDAAAAWVVAQDPSPHFARFVDEEIAHARRALRRDH